MSPADTNRTTTAWLLADLFDALRREGFQLRPDDYVEIDQVLNAFQPQSPADLQALIAPLIVTSNEEQEKFDRIFDGVWQKKGIKPHLIETEPTENEAEKTLPWTWISAGLLGLLAFVYVAFLWPAPTFQPDIRLISGSAGPLEVGDTLVLGIDSSLSQASGARARWQWEMPDGKLYPKPSEPELQVVAKRAGPLVVNLRSQRGEGLLFTTWTDSLRSMKYPICDKLPVIQMDSARMESRSGTVRYRFKARVVQASSAVQLTQWRVDGEIVARNQTEWERSFPVGTTPTFYEVRFDAIPDTAQRLCFGEAKLTIGIQPQSEPPFTLDVRQTGNLIVPRMQLDRHYFWALCSLGILLILLIGVYLWMIVRDRRAEKSESPKLSGSESLLAGFASDEPPLEIPFDKRDAESITRDQSFYRLVRTLRQPTEGDSQRLHLARTMQATMREGGFPTLVFQPHATETEYLFLIERNYMRSQQVALFDYLFRALVQENVCIERFFFHKTFDLFTNEKQLRGIPLRQLADTYRRHTLIIWGDGYPLLYPPYPVVEPAIREALTDWESKAILTPVPFADWGAKERALQTDFLLLPADLIGQLRLIQALNEKQTFQDTYLRQQSEEFYSTEYVDVEEIDELRDYLGDDLFQWLAALAVYPRIRWEIVVEMGRTLLTPQRVNFTNLLRLARIRWMHEGNFPDYTRLELLKALRPENEVKARKRLLKMFAYAEKYFPGKHFYDGEKYLLQTANQFILYAHDPDTFTQYQSAQQAFKQLYEKSLYPDVATLRYLENPDGEWTTLLPPAESRSKEQSTGLRSYIENLPASQPDEVRQSVEEPAKRDPKRVYVLGAILLVLPILAGMWYVSTRSQNQVQDLNQQIPVTIVLEPDTCVTALNTSVTDSPRWTVSLNDSLYSISNLYATRSFPITALASGTTTDVDDRTRLTSLRATVAIKDTTGEEQSTTVPLTRDTLRVRVNCRVPIKPDLNPKLSSTIYIQYASQEQAAAARQLQARLGAIGFAVPGIELRSTFRDSTQVRYFDDQNRSEADSAAAIVKSLFKLRTVRVIKVGGSKKAPVEVWINNGVTAQPFVCQNVPISWLNRFDNWETGNDLGLGAGVDWLISVSVMDRRVSVQDINSRDDDGTPLGIGFGMNKRGGIRSICRQKNLYLVQVTFEGNEALLFKNVTRTRADIALIKLDTKQLNGQQGQAYFDRLVKTANFRRYTLPEQPQNQTNSTNPVQQTAPVGNDYTPNVSQTDLAVQMPVQSATEKLRIESGNIKDDRVQKGINAYRRGQYAEAITSYDQYLADNPGSAYVLNLKGYSQFKLRQYEQAISTLLMVTKADPTYAWAYFDLARVYCAMGRSSEANQAREQAISLRSDMQTIMQNDEEFMRLCGRGATAK